MRQGWTRQRHAAALPTAAAIGFAVAGCGTTPGSGGREPSPGVVARSPSSGAAAIESVEPWTYAGKPGRVVTTAHYRIWTTQTDAVTGSRLPAFMEAAMAQYRTGVARLARTPLAATDRLDVFMMGGREQWESLTRQLLGEGAPAYLRIPRGGYAWAGKAVLYDIGAAQTLQLSAHEGWHQYTQRTFREALPTWAEEGIATFMEGFVWSGAGVGAGEEPVFLGWANLERFDELRVAHATGRLRPLSELLGVSPRGLLGNGSVVSGAESPRGGADASDDALTYYAQLWALVHFLREGEGGKHRTGLERMIADAAEGRLSDRVNVRVGQGGRKVSLQTAEAGAVVFAAYFGGDFGAMNGAYTEFVGRIVRTGSRQAIAEGRSPVE